MTTGLYIHIPYCKKKCNYCDFYSLGGSCSVPQEYVEAVKREIAKYDNLMYSTVYFGGGTPSLLTGEQVQDILSCVCIEKDAEITLEANPDTLTTEKLSAYRQSGVNRLSIGVQSAYNSSLKSLGRIHDANGAASAFKMAKDAGFTNINGDMMLGLSGYSKNELFDTVDFLKAQGVTHISAYMLKIEKGTPFYANPPENLSNEEEMADFYLMACEKLEKEGYKQYEISNFCFPGYESKHNSSYWQLKNYIGIGPSAHSCVDGKRFFYPADLQSFIKGTATLNDGEIDVDDFVMLSLRLKSGLNFNRLQSNWGVKLNDHIQKKLSIYENVGLIEKSGNTISLTPKGFLAENAIASDIMSGLIPL